MEFYYKKGKNHLKMQPLYNHPSPQKEMVNSS